VGTGFPSDLAPNLKMEAGSRNGRLPAIRHHFIMVSQ
jgi:hypothetical protein